MRRGFAWVATAVLTLVTVQSANPVTAAQIAGGPAAPAIADGLALTPPMGWQSFKAFQKGIDEVKIKRMADLLVSTGLRDLGYDILIVDGGWRLPICKPNGPRPCGGRDSNGNMRHHPDKFPSGMKALGDYIHSKSLRFGLHQAVGETDCANQDPGTQSGAPGGEQRDANLFASWGVDVLKYDLCKYRFPADATPGAPDYDKIILSKGGTEISYEAESTANTVTGDTRVHACGRCSNGKSVTAVGFRNGSLTFAVNAPTAGEYTMQIKYVNVNRSTTGIRQALGRERYAQVSVNGQAPTITRYPIPTRGEGDQLQVTDWDTVSTISVPSRLGSVI